MATQRLTREANQALTRARLVEAAGEVFAEKGFYGASVEEVTELETRLRNAQETQDVQAAEPSNRLQIAAAAESARGVEVEARLVVRTAEERANAVRGRADSLRQKAR